MSEFNINEKEQKCDRCQSEPPSIICETCQPYHNFCYKCDSIIHAMKIKSTHNRIPISNFLEPPEPKSPTQNKIHLNSLTPDRRTYRSPSEVNLSFNNIINDKFNNKRLSINLYKRNNIDSNYSDNYINELKKINEKEKDALKYKIETLEKYIERLKSNLQNELKNSEIKCNQYLNEKKNLEEKINQLIEGTFK